MSTTISLYKKEKNTPKNCAALVSIDHKISSKIHISTPVVC